MTQSLQMRVGIIHWERGGASPVIFREPEPLWVAFCLASLICVKNTPRAKGGPFSFTTQSLSFFYLLIIYFKFMVDVYGTY